MTIGGDTGAVAALARRIRDQFNTVKGLIAAREPGIAAGTAAQYWRGDKTWQTLNPGAVGAEPTLPGGGTIAQYLRGDKTWANFTGAVAANLPTRLGGVTTIISDLNNAIDAGWYAAPASTLNTPIGASGGGYWNVLVSNYYGYGYTTQQAFEVSTGGAPKIFVRQMQGSVWGAWRQMDPESMRPAGEVTMWAGATAPAGWLFCRGQAYSAATYPALFAVIGYTYGGASGTFYLPDFQARFPLGVGSQVLGADEGDTTTSARNARLSHNHSHLMGAHTHSLSITNNATQSGVGSRTNSPNTGGMNGSPSTGTDGSDQHAFLAMNFIIRT